MFLAIRVPTLWFLVVLWCSVTSGQYYPSIYSVRFRCPTQFPTRLSLANSVVLTGFVEDVKPGSNDDDQYMASVLVSRVLYGPRDLSKTHIQITGFGSYPGDNTWCHTNVGQGESWIFVLQPINYPDYFRLNASLIKITMNNLEKLDAIIADDPFRPLTKMETLPCEKKYCENNANCIPDPYSAGGAKCECLTYCKPQYSPVCGSNGETYNNECELRLRSCYIGKNLFVKSMNTCYYAGRVPSTSSQSRPSTYQTYRPSNQNSHQTYQTQRTHITNRYTFNQ